MKKHSIFLFDASALAVLISYLLTVIAFVIPAFLVSLLIYLFFKKSKVPSWVVLLLIIFVIVAGFSIIWLLGGGSLKQFLPGYPNY